MNTEQRIAWWAANRQRLAKMIDAELPDGVYFALLVAHNPDGTTEGDVAPGAHVHYVSSMDRESAMETLRGYADTQIPRKRPEIDPHAPENLN